MLKKLILILVIIITSFFIIIYLNPDLAKKIENTIWLYWFSEKLMWYKSTYDEVVTKIPTKEKIEDAKNIVIEKIDGTKEIIDNIRVWEKDIKQKYENTKEFIDKTEQKIDEIKSTIDDIENMSSWVLNNISTWITNINSYWNWIINTFSSWNLNTN